MELMNVGKALSNETRLQLLQLIAKEPDSATGVHQRYLDRYNEERHRESIYRALETLVDANLLSKEYENEHGLIYELAHEQLVIDLEEGDVSSVSKRTERSD